MEFRRFIHGVSIAVAGILATVVLYASASYPTSIKSFTTKLSSEVIQPAHVNDLQDEVVALETDLISGLARLRLGTNSTTVAGGIISVTKSQYAVDTEGAAAADDLDTITAGSGIGAGSLLLLTAANVAHVVTVKDSTGNVKLAGGDVALNSAKRSLLLSYDGTNWIQVASPISNPTFTVAIQAPAGTVGAVGLGVGDTDVGLYSSGTNALDVATNGVKALGIGSTQFIDSPTQPRSSAYNNGTQSIAGTTPIALTFDSEDYDVGAMHSTGSNTARITVPTGGDGLYVIRGGTQWAANGTGYRFLQLKKDGSTVLTNNCIQAADPTNNSITQQEVSFIAVLAAADYIEILAAQQSGGPLNAGSATREAASHLQLVKLW